MRKSDSPWKMIALVSAIGMDLAFFTFTGVYAGRYLDRVWDTGPLFLLIGLLAGLAFGIYGVFLLVKSIMGD
ncbi:MAG: AtpZ/AtpI family protein [Bacillaceae bacterium]|nr:AtpZ/AtpI family protein [Bacillaceae bacterium]